MPLPGPQLRRRRGVGTHEQDRSLPRQPVPLGGPCSADFPPRRANGFGPGRSLIRTELPGVAILPHGSRRSDPDCRATIILENRLELPRAHEAPLRVLAARNPEVECAPTENRQVGESSPFRLLHIPSPDRSEPEPAETGADSAPLPLLPPRASAAPTSRLGGVGLRRWWRALGRGGGERGRKVPAADEVVRGRQGFAGRNKSAEARATGTSTVLPRCVIPGCARGRRGRDLGTPGQRSPRGLGSGAPSSDAGLRPFLAIDVASNRPSGRTGSDGSRRDIPRVARFGNYLDPDDEIGLIHVRIQQLAAASSRSDQRVQVRLRRV